MNNNNRYEYAKARYADLGIDTDKALEQLEKVNLSLHCWQTDDVGGFETPDAALSGGGIQVTGNYPGKSRSLDEMRQDLEKAFTLIPGKHRLNLHAIYGEFGGKQIDRNKIGPEHFTSWIDWAKENTAGLDFNGTYFSHPLASDGYTLSHREKSIREFWIEHGKKCRDIAASFGKALGTKSVHNTWIPDGDKELPVDRMGYRERLQDSLDRMFKEPLPANHMIDAVETKLFGIGSESYVVGSHEFYLGYALKNNKIICFDLGHFHPTEQVADKISSALLYFPELLLHVSRPVRWDSDHVVILNDDIRDLTQELVRCNALDKTYIGLDYFDGTINRIGAYAIGSRATLKGILMGLLEPTDKLIDFDKGKNSFGRLALLEELKYMPYGDIWDHYCEKTGTPRDRDLFSEVSKYEQNILSKRG
jgi:L-rhamnose isomerase